MSDDYRIEYFKMHIEQMKKAVEEDGVDLMGYTPWGCIVVDRGIHAVGHIVGKSDVIHRAFG